MQWYVFAVDSPDDENMWVKMLRREMHSAAEAVAAEAEAEAIHQEELRK